MYIARRGGTYPELPGNLHLEGDMGQNKLFARQLIRQPIPYKVGPVEFKKVRLSYYTSGIMESGGMVIELLVLNTDEKQAIGAEILEQLQRDPYFVPELSPSELCTRPGEEILSTNLYLCFKGNL